MPQLPSQWQTTSCSWRGIRQSHSTCLPCWAARLPCLQVRKLGAACTHRPCRLGVDVDPAAPACASQPADEPAPSSGSLQAVFLVVRIAPWMCRSFAEGGFSQLFTYACTSDTITPSLISAASCSWHGGGCPAH